MKIVGIVLDLIDIVRLILIQKKNGFCWVGLHNDWEIDCWKFGWIGDIGGDWINGSSGNLLYFWVGDLYCL